MASSIQDISARNLALDIQRSYHVSAGAGSGKTGLLTQRFLKLLTIASRPEAVIAKTFTNKAAAEMRARIINALKQGAEDTPPENDYERQTWDLAREVIQRDSELDWGLLKNPNRLNIQTIDSFCNHLTRQMPILSQFGSQVEISDNPAILYREAALRVLNSLEDNSNAWNESLTRLLIHLDNDYSRITELFVAIMGNREQWLPHVMSLHGKSENETRENLESNLQDAINNTLNQVSDALAPFQSSIIDSINFAAGKLNEQGIESPITACTGIHALPHADASNLPQWVGIASFLLTRDKSRGTVAWRKRADKNLGFPAKAADIDTVKIKKQEYLELLESLSANEELLSFIGMVFELPSGRYTDDQWETLSALLKILPILVANLKLVFTQYGQVDYTEIARAALHSLGTDDAPTDLALRYDNQIEHILVDEFQDTNNLQIGLIRILTAGWQPGDGKTLFIVGDPMQSIYRFRQADVGLFLASRQYGIGSIEFTPLDLTVNFRSQGALVRDINQIFSDALPSKDNASAGAVAYTPSSEFHPHTAAGVEFLAFSNQVDRLQEAQAVCDIIKKTKAEMPNAKIAILARNRTHLNQIIPAMKSSDIAFQAMDIDALSERPAIQDLLTLTQALSHPGNRLAWFSLLRSPYVGLSKDDLLIVSDSIKKGGTVISQLNNTKIIYQLTSVTQERITYIAGILTQALKLRHRKDIRHWIEGVWIALGGPATVSSTDLDNAETFFGLLEQFSSAQDPVDMDKLSDAVDRLYAAPDRASAESGIQVMTLHKSKGLQFDVVVIPGVDRVNGKTDPSLLAWQERTSSGGYPQLLMAPISATGHDQDPIYQFIQREEKRRDRFETTRLFYVGCTRAKQTTYILANVETIDDSESIKKPDSRSLLHCIWDQVKNRVQLDISTTPIQQLEFTGLETRNMVHRLPKNWALPALPQGDELAKYRGLIVGNRDNVPDYDWSLDHERIVGIVVHRCLKQICIDGKENWNSARIEKQRPIWKTQLAQEGLTQFMLNQATSEVQEHIENALSSEFADWAFSRAHREYRPEYPINCVNAGKVCQFYIDLTFVDSENTCWIIDFKTSKCSPEDTLEVFIEQQSDQHRPQLKRYAQAMGSLHDGPVKTGLFFTGEQRFIALESHE